MQFSLSAFTALALAQLVAAFNPAHDSCVPEAHIFHGASTSGYVPCTLSTNGGTRLAIFACGNLGSVAYDPSHNTVSVSYYKATGGGAGGTVRRNLYGSCTKDSGGAQIAHVSISTPIGTDGITAHTYAGFNRPCESAVDTLQIDFSLYGLTNQQLEQCYAHPIAPRS